MEHCLEHFPDKVGDMILNECRRVLKPKGIFRVVVPDAELYLTRYADRVRGRTSERFPYEKADDVPMSAVNGVFYIDRHSPYGHQTMYDFDLLQKVLRQVGFSKISRVGYRDGIDPLLLIDSDYRRVESLYVEAFSD